jgi:hypothetical protein
MPVIAFADMFDEIVALLLVATLAVNTSVFCARAHGQRYTVSPASISMLRRSLFAPTHAQQPCSGANYQSTKDSGATLSGACQGFTIRPLI